MKTLIHHAFSLWRQFIDSNRDNLQPGLIVYPELAKGFQAVAIDAEIAEVFEIGRSYGFAPVSIINMLALNGGYFRLLQSGVLSRGECRFLDSLYHPTFPELTYNVNNSEILAPWITLSAKEALLDLGLSSYTVVEYGSGMSTFFFVKEAKACYSFEDDADPAGRGSWSSVMQAQAGRINQSINLIRPDLNNCLPECIVQDLWQGIGNLLVSIDGGDRCKHFSDWAKYIGANRQHPIVLLVDNSEIGGFDKDFERLCFMGASIDHCYGNVYGQLTTKQCTSFVTFNPALMHLAGAAPSGHDQRWGKMNMQ